MAQVERVTDELKRLVGWGAQVHRLPTLPQLREVLAPPADLSLVSTGDSMRRTLARQIKLMQDSYVFAGREVSAENVRRALRQLLALEGAIYQAPRRRWEAMKILGTCYSVDQWRRPAGPERELLGLLADHLCESETVAA